jgi:hypothetical protein
MCCAVASVNSGDRSKALQAHRRRAVATVNSASSGQREVAQGCANAQRSVVRIDRAQFAAAAEQTAPREMDHLLALFISRDATTHGEFVSMRQEVRRNSNPTGWGMGAFRV